MLNSITVTNYKGDSLDISLFNPRESGFLISNIDGITPDGASINTTDFGYLDGAVFNSARMSSRNIVLEMYYLINPEIGLTNIEETRHKAYKYFPLKRQVTLTFHTDTRTSQITGYVESNSADIFSEKELGQVSIICPDPYFYEPEIQSAYIYGIESEFEFPFENDSLTDRLLCMSDIRTADYTYIKYDGDFDIGFELEIIFLESANVYDFTDGLKIVDLNREVSFTIDMEKIKSLYNFEVVHGDKIFISSVKGNKYIYYWREGQYTDILNAFDKNMEWLEIYKGDNAYTYLLKDGAEYIQLKFNYRSAYEGI